jgi:hypothetical protein
MKRLLLLLLFLVVGVSHLYAATPTDTPTWTPTSTATPSNTPTFSATLTASPTPTFTPTFTTVLTPAPVATLDGQKERQVVQPQLVVLNDRVTKPLATPASTPDDPYLLNVNGHTAVAWALSTSAGVINVCIPGDYKGNPRLWAYTNTTGYAGTTMNLRTDVELARMGAAAPVTFFAGVAANVAAVVYPGSLNDSSTKDCVRVMLPLPGGYAQSVTYTPYRTGIYVPGALKPGDTLAIKLFRLSGGNVLRFLRFELEYDKNPGLNP